MLEYVQITVTFLIVSHNCETDLHISGSSTMHCENMVWFGFSCLSWESAGPAPLDYPDDTEELSVDDRRPQGGTGPLLPAGNS